MQFCKSAQSWRCSRGNVWRIWNPSRQIGATWCGDGTINCSSLVLSVIKTEIPSDWDDPAYQNFLLQQFEERIERLSQQDKLSTFCMDAGFLSVVENWQYFMTKDIGDITQFNTVACREYTLQRKDATSHPKGWIQGKHQNWARVGSRNQL